MRIQESLNVTFNESLPKPKSFPLVEDDMINESIVQYLNGFPSLQANVLDEGYPKSVKEARGHLIEQVIGSDIAIITRKEPKTGEKRTREQKEYTRARNYQEKSTKVNIGQPWSTHKMTKP
nr:hypothetical protein [Tanacetum cinerariifolium]